MNSDITIHCIQCEFMNLISLLWILKMNSLLKIDENSIFWIHNIEFSMAYEYIVMNSKESKFRFLLWIHSWIEYLWIYKSYFMGEFMVSYKKHSAAAQYNQPEHL